MTHGIDTNFLVALEIINHASHASSRDLLARIIAAGDRLALAPQVLTEFLHVVTDARRLAAPLDMRTAHGLAERWWMAGEVEHVFPDDNVTRLFLVWVDKHRLGRKRLIDTLLAATYRAAGITSLVTLNAKDFEVIGEFACLTPGAS